MASDEISNESVNAARRMSFPEVALRKIGLR